MSLQQQINEVYYKDINLAAILDRAKDDFCRNQLRCYALAVSSIFTDDKRRFEKLHTLIANDAKAKGWIE